jgi:death-on-curing protein
VERVVVDAVHWDQLREHGGLAGIRDEAALESALARPRHKWRYRETTDLASLAAAYGFGLCRNHPYRDGNKRVAFVVMAVFLQLNGFTPKADDTEVVTVMLALANGKLSERELAAWLGEHSRKTKGRRAI